MTNPNDPLWIRIAKSLAWYVWLALAPLIRRAILGLDAGAENHANGDPDNKLHSSDS